MVTCIVLGYIVFLPSAITLGDYLISIKLYLYEFGVRKVFRSIAGNAGGLYEFMNLPVAIERISILFIIICIAVGIIVYIMTSCMQLLYLCSLFSCLR